MKIKQYIQVLLGQRTEAGVVAQECINDEISNLVAGNINNIRIQRSYHICNGIYKQALPYVTKREAYYLKKQIVEGILKWQY